MHRTRKGIPDSEVRATEVCLYRLSSNIRRRPPFPIPMKSTAQAVFDNNEYHQD
jgi:hypothetical protein